MVRSEDQTATAATASLTAMSTELPSAPNTPEGVHPGVAAAGDIASSDTIIDTSTDKTTARNVRMKPPRMDERSISPDCALHDFTG